MAFEKRGAPSLRKRPEKEKDSVRQEDSSEHSPFAEFDHLSPNDRERVMLDLLRSDQGAVILDNLPLLTRYFDFTDLATLFARDGHARFVVDNASLLQECDLRALVEATLDAGNSELVFERISDLRFGFRGDADMLETFISCDHAETAIANLEKFLDLDPLDALDAFVKHGRSDLVLDNLRPFLGIEYASISIARCFLRHKDVDAFFEFMDVAGDALREKMVSLFVEDFRGLEGTPFAGFDRLSQGERENAALDLLRSGRGAVILDNLHLLLLYFDVTNLATLFARHRHARFVINNASLLEECDLRAFVGATLDAGNSKLVFARISDLGSSSFGGFGVVLESLISHGHADTVIATLEEILEESWGLLLPREAMDAFFKCGRFDLVFENLDLFSEVEPKRIAERFLEADVDTFLAFMRRFPDGGYEREEMLSLFIKERHGRFVVDHLDDQFSDFDRSYIASLLFDFHQGDLALENSDSFPDLDPNDMIELFIKNGDGSTLAKRLDCFPNTDPETIAQRFFDYQRGDIVAEHLHRFGTERRRRFGKDMSRSIASDLADPRNFPDSVRIGLRALFFNRSLFDPPLTKEDLVELSPKDQEKWLLEWLFGGDPNWDHPDRLNPEKRGKAREFLRLLEGKHVSGYSESDMERLSALREGIDSAIDAFFDSISSDDAIPDDEVSALRQIVPQWVLESTALYLPNNPGMLSNDPDTRDLEMSHLLDRVLKPSLKRVQELYTIDIPLYDIVYEAFDDLRANRDSLLEVYLGRDGVYAFLGRRAEDVARRRAMGRAARKRIKAEDADRRRRALDPAAPERIESDKGTLGIYPRYIVYPRTFIEDLASDEKQEYLRPLDIPSNNAIFFDTGYEGSVPSDIMRCLGFSESEIDERIHLLSATTDVHRVRNVPVGKQARDNVLKIEDSAKPEESATGLYLDQRDGLLRHAAKLTSPSEQFEFSLIRKALISYNYRKNR